MKKNIGLFLLSIVLIGLVSCSSVADFFITDADQREMGRQYHEELCKDPEYPIDSTSRLARYIDSLGRFIVRANDDGENRGMNFNFDYNFYLVNDDEQINAFALPGGFIYMYEGLIEKAASEDQIAGVLAHEIGHVAGEHSKEQMVKAAGISKIREIVTPQTNAGNLAADLIAYMGVQSVSRNDEYQSDSLAAAFITNTSNLNPNGMVEFLDTLATLGQSIEIFNSHPNSDNRSDTLQAIIDNNDDYLDASRRAENPKRNF